MPTWTKEEKEFVINAVTSGEKSYAEIGKSINKRSHCIYEFCKRNSIKSKRKKAGERIYFHDENYFATKNLENCYFAGILMADGCIKDSRSSSKYDLVWSVAEKDEYILNKFKEAIKFTGEIKIFKKGKNPKGKGIQKMISIYGCRKLAEDLANNFGVTRNKTYRCVVQNFETEEQKLAFMIGLIDGDGSVFGASAGKRPTIKLCSSSIPTLEWFERTVLELKLPFLGRVNRKIIKGIDKNCYYYTVSGLEAAFLYKKLININVPKFPRKWLNKNMIKSVNDTIEKWNNSPFNPQNKLEKLINHV